MPASQQAIAIILLAAGQSSRFGSSKMQATIDDKPLLTHAIETLQLLEGCDLWPVLGPEQTALQALAPTQQQVLCHDAAKGIGHSISCGVKHALQSATLYRGFLIALADQVAITAHDYRSLLDQFQQGHAIVAARYGQVCGAPAIFDRRYAKELIALRGDQGARRLLKQHAGQLVTVDIPRGALDIDTPEQLQQYLQNR